MPHRSRASIIAAVWTILSVLPGARAHAIELGGVDVPKERFVVYLLVGHSNMAGRSVATDTTPHPRVWNYEVHNSAFQWRPARAPLHPDHKTGARGGPGMPLLKALARSHPDHYIGVIQVAHSGSGVKADFLDETRQRLYSEIIAAAKRVQQQGVTFGGVVAMLGYVEASVQDGGAQANAFAAHTKLLMDKFRGDLGEPELPLLIGTHEMHSPTVPTYRDVVNQQVLSMPQLIHRCAIIDSEGPYLDGWHFTYEGHRLWGEAAAALVEAKGWFPKATGAADSSPPRVLSAQSTDQPNQIRVRFSEPLDVMSARRATAYTLGDALTVSSATLDQSLASVVLTAQGLTGGQAYAVQIEGVTDLAGNAVAVGSQVALTHTGPQIRALFVVRSPSLDPGDAVAKARMESLGFNVTVVEATASQAAHSSGKQLVVISSTVESTHVNTKFRDVPVPVVVWEPSIFDDMGFTGASEGSDLGGTAGQTLHLSAGITHPLAAGLSGAVDVARETVLVWGVVGGDPRIIATLPGDDTKATLFAYDKGAQMYAGPAPAKRVGLFLVGDTLTRATAEGLALFDAALTWAALNRPPVADVGPAVSVDAGSRATLDASRTVDPEHDALSYHWLQTGGPRVQLDDSQSPRPSFDTPEVVDPITLTFRLTVADAEYQDATDAVLQVLPPAEITLTSPQGEEVLQGGSTLDIRWEAVNVDDVTIRLSLDNGDSWNTIASSIDRASSDWGKWPWRVPQVATAAALIEISGYIGDDAVRSAPFEIASSGEISESTDDLLAGTVPMEGGCGVVPRSAAFPAWLAVLLLVVCWALGLGRRRQRGIRMAVARRSRPSGF